MYKMIILDDEYLVRMGLTQTINWKDNNIEIIGEATNGKEGLALAKSVKPDIIISDVKMPIMDGLEFVKAIKEEQIDAICIMLSGYKDFEYAKSTLETGAFSYLLKPIDCDKLIEKVQEAIVELEKRRKNKEIVKTVNDDLPLIKNTIIQSLIAGNYQDIADLINKNNLYNLQIPQSGRVIYGRVDNAINYTDTKIVKKAMECLYNTFIKNLDPNIKYCGVMYYSHFVILIDTIPNSVVINRIINQYEHQEELIISLGVSNQYNDFSNIYEKYLEAKKMVKNKMFLTLNTISIDNEDVIQYKKIVIDVIKYISENYCYNIDINTISHDLNVSSSHLMHQFKDDVGKTVNEFLTEYRISVAKQLLSSGKYRIYEIAEKIGYSDSKYFTQVFKKITGLTPAEYTNE